MSQSGLLLKRARSAAGLSQRELSSRTGIAHTLISAYENGRRVPGGDALLRLLGACRASIDLDRSGRHASAAAALEQVAAIAMELPRRDPGPLRYPSFRRLTPR